MTPKQTYFNKDMVTCGTAGKLFLNTSLLVIIEEIKNLLATE